MISYWPRKPIVTSILKSKDKNIMKKYRLNSTSIKVSALFSKNKILNSKRSYRITNQIIKQHKIKSIPSKPHTADKEIKTTNLNSKSTDSDSTSKLTTSDHKNTRCIAPLKSPTPSLNHPNKSYFKMRLPTPPETRWPNGGSRPSRCGEGRWSYHLVTCRMWFLLHRPIQIGVTNHHLNTDQPAIPFSGGVLNRRQTDIQISLILIE